MRRHASSPSTSRVCWTAGTSFAKLAKLVADALAGGVVAADVVDVVEQDGEGGFQLGDAVGGNHGAGHVTGIGKPRYRRVLLEQALTVL